LTLRADGCPAENHEAPQLSLGVALDRNAHGRYDGSKMVSYWIHGGAAVPSITVKSIPDELYERIKQSAAEHRRSINKEVIICLERTLLARRVNPAAFLARADALREQSNLPPLTDNILRKAKAEGRP